MDRYVHSFDAQHLHVILVHVVAMKCEKYSLKSDILDENSNFQYFFPYYILY